MTDLEGRIKVTVTCSHKKNDFAIYYFCDAHLETRACLCSDCMPQYKRLIDGYQKTKKVEDDDGFDEKEMRYQDEPE